MMHANAKGAGLAQDHAKAESAPYLSSHRALAACSREFARLAAAVGHAAATISDPAEDKVDARLSPDRFMVQLGPVALTIGWLRGSTESVELGELLVIVWRGSVTQRSRFEPERPSAALARATALWEETFAARGTDEASWLWRPSSADVGGYSSAELADRCVGELRRAYVKARGAR